MQTPLVVKDGPGVDQFDSDITGVITAAGLIVVKPLLRY
jgi:hypothetical protein